MNTARFNQDSQSVTRVGASAMSLLIIDDDAMLAADAAGLGVDDLGVQMAATVAEIDLHARRAAHDVVVISLDLDGAFDAMQKLCAMRDGPLVIAIAARGRGKVSLEHTLTVAELHGAAASLPKPIDASELALAAVQVMQKKRTGDERLGVLAARLEKLALF